MADIPDIVIDRTSEQLIHAIDSAENIDTDSKVEIGGGASAETGTTAVGMNSTASGTFATAVGNTANAGADNSVAVGRGSRTNNDGAIAIGYSAIANAENAIQIGSGTNTTANSVKLYNTLLLHNGKVPLSSVDIAAGTGIIIQGNIISATGGGGGTAYTMGNTMQAPNNVLDVKNGGIDTAQLANGAVTAAKLNALAVLTKLGWNVLDIAGAESNTVIVNSLPNGIYIANGNGYITKTSGTSAQKEEMKTGDILVKYGGYITYLSAEDGSLYTVKISGTDAWGNHYLIDSQTVNERILQALNVLSDYLTKSEANTTYQRKKTSTTINDNSTVTLADNTEYTGSAISTLTLNFPSGNFECYISLTTASSGTIAIDFDSNAKFIGDEPTFSTGEQWEISVKNGVVVAGKVE